MKRRAYQEQAFWANKKLRRYMLGWLRQGGKSSTLAEQSLLEMAEHQGRLITFATASLNLGGEMPEKEAQLWQRFVRDMRSWAEERKMQLVAGERRHVADADSWRQLPDDIDIGGLADVLEHSKFEVRLRHSNTVSSRLKVIAANVQTARGFTGSVKLDEAPFVDDLRTLMAEMEPIFSTDPTFCFLMAGTPPPDYADYAYELFTPDNGVEDYPLNPEGNWFKNRIGWWVHRVSIDDAAAAGRKNYHPETGKEVTPDEAREASSDKEGWDRSNRLARPKMGRSAISPGALSTAQTKGINKGLACEWPPEQLDLPEGALDHCKGNVTLGLDLGTTEKQTSNPTSISVKGMEAGEHHIGLTLWWKSADPAVTKRRVTQILKALIARGCRPVGMGIDATNERNYAREIRDDNANLCDIRLIIGSENVPLIKDVDGVNVNFKAHKGNLFSTAAEAGRVILPWSRYLYDDCMRVTRNKGTFDCTVGSQGEHGDTFDSIALCFVIEESGGPAQVFFPQIGDLATNGPDDSEDGFWTKVKKSIFHA
jgi:hypothetical protein